MRAINELRKAARRPPVLRYHRFVVKRRGIRILMTKPYGRQWAGRTPEQGFLLPTPKAQSWWYLRALPEYLPGRRC